MTTETTTAKAPRQRTVHAVVYAKGNQRRVRSLWSSAARAQEHIDTVEPKADRPHLEVEAMTVNGPF